MRMYPALFLIVLAAALPACKARKDFPEPGVGWHSPSFSVVYGTLRRLPGPNPDDDPTWVVIFGPAHGAYQGMLALTPPVKLTGYSGGERVELKGRMLDRETVDAFNGRWYVVDSIQYWSGYR